MSVDFAKKHLNARKRLLRLLSDLKWHHFRSLRIAGIRYSARLLELKREGYRIISKGNEDGKEYRLRSLKKGSPQPKRVKVFLDPTDVEKFLAGYAPGSGFIVALQLALGSFLANKDKL